MPIPEINPDKVKKIAKLFSLSDELIEEVVTPKDLSYLSNLFTVNELLGFCDSISIENTETEYLAKKN